MRPIARKSTRLSASCGVVTTYLALLLSGPAVAVPVAGDVPATKGVQAQGVSTVESMHPEGVSRSERGCSSDDPNRVDVYVGSKSGDYWKYMSPLIERARAKLHGRYSFELHETHGSMDNYLRMKRCPRSLGLMQEDVADLGVKMDQRARGKPQVIRALGSPFAEHVFVIAPRRIQDLDDVRAIDLGSDASGSAFTFSRVAPELEGFFRLRPVISRRGGVNRSAFPEMSSADASVQAAFRVSRKADLVGWDIGPQGNNQLLDLGEATIQRIVVALPVYNEGEIVTPDGTRLQTLDVDTLVLGGMGLPEEVGTLLVALMAQELGVTGEDLMAPAGARQPFQDLGVPEHPVLIRTKMGALPYLDAGIALALSVLLLLLHLWLWMRGSYYGWVWKRNRLQPPPRSTVRRHAWSVTVLLLVVVWTLAASLLLKWVEVEPLLQGRLTDASGVWRMNLRESLTWMFVLVSMGQDQSVFPVTTAGRLLAVSIQLGSWLGLLWVLGSLSVGVVERVIRRFLKQEVPVKLTQHVVICNWRPTAEIILTELRNAAVVGEQPRRLPIVLIGEGVKDDAADLHEDVYVVAGRASERVVLQRAHVGSAKAVIILRSSDEAVESDAQAVMTCIEVRRLTERAGRNPDEQVVLAEVFEASVGADMRRLGVREVGTEGSFEVSLMAQTVITPRISHFFDELLRYEQDSVELYTTRVPPWLTGHSKTFGEAVSALYHASLLVTPDNPLLLVGIQRGSDPAAPVLLNPRGGAEQIRSLAVDDRCIVLAYHAPDDGALAGFDPAKLSEAHPVAPLTTHHERGQARVPAPTKRRLKQHIAFCGWSSAGARILKELRLADHVAHSDAAVVVLTDKPVKLEQGEIFEDVTVIPMDPSAPGALVRANLAEARSIVLLADRDKPTPDSHSLLLALRIEALLADLPASTTARRPNVSAEVVDPRWVSYFKHIGVDEPVCATEMLYRVFAQAVNNPSSVSIFQHLLRITADTNEVYLVAVPNDLMEDAHFADAVQWYSDNRSADNPALLVGYRTPRLEVVVNPRGDALRERLTAEHCLLVMQYQRA